MTGFRVAGGKSDPFDAFVLCELARTDHHRFRVLEPDCDQTKAIRALTRAREDLVAARTGIVNQLRAELERFWPEVGDVTRFPTARHLCAWAGLAPTVRSSDGKARLGHISRQGCPAMRWALTEAAQKIPTGGGPLRAQFERIAKRRGRNIAKVAIARQILALCYYGLRDGEIRCLKDQPTTDNHDDELANAA